MSANPVRQGGSRSSHNNQRMPSPNCFSIPDKTHNQEDTIPVSSSKGFISFRKSNQQPPLIDSQFENSEVSVLPPIPTIRTAVRTKVKPRISTVSTSVQSQKRVSGGSAKRQTSGIRRMIPPAKANPPTFHNSKQDVEVSIIGTSFDPILRPIRIKTRPNATL